MKKPRNIPRPQPELLSTAGLGCLAAGAWVWLGVAAGIAAIGAALLLTAWITEE